MDVGDENPVGLWCHGRFYIGVVCHGHQKVVSKVMLCMFITGIVRVRTIWHKILLKLEVSFDGIVSRKEVISDSSHYIETHIDVIIEILEVQISVSF